MEDFLVSSLNTPDASSPSSRPSLISSSPLISPSPLIEQEREANDQRREEAEDQDQERGQDQDEGGERREEGRSRLGEESHDDLREMSAIDGEGVAFIHDLLRLEGELKSKDHQLEGLLRQTTQLGRVVKSKEVSFSPFSPSCLLIVSQSESRNE